MWSVRIVCVLLFEGCTVYVRRCKDVIQCVLVCVCVCIVCVRVCVCVVCMCVGV